MFSKAYFKKTVFAVFLSLFVAAFCAFAAFQINAYAASAQEEYSVESFAMENGASVRMDDKKALRFTSAVNKAEFDAIVAAAGEENVKVVTMITYTDALAAVADFVKDSVFTANVVYSVANNNLYGVDDSENYVYNACLFDLEDKNISKYFSARSYIEVNGEIIAYTAYSEENNSRSAYDVAKAAIEDKVYVVEGDEALTNANLINLQYLASDFTVTISAQGYDDTQITLKRGEAVADYLADYYEQIGVDGVCTKISDETAASLTAPVSEEKEIEVEIVTEHNFSNGVCSDCGELQYRIAQHIYEDPLRYIGFGAWGEDDGNAETINAVGSSISFKTEFFKQALAEGYTHVKFHAEVERKDGNPVTDGIMFDGGGDNYMKLYAYVDGGVDVRVELTKFQEEENYKSAVLLLVDYSSDSDYTLSGFEFFKSPETVSWNRSGPSGNPGYIYAAMENGKLVIDNNYSGPASYVEIDPSFFAFQIAKMGSISMSYDVLNGGGGEARNFLLHFDGTPVINTNQVTEYDYLKYVMIHSGDVGGNLQSKKLGIAGTEGTYAFELCPLTCVTPNAYFTCTAALQEDGSIYVDMGTRTNAEFWLNIGNCESATVTLTVEAAESPASFVIYNTGSKDNWIDNGDGTWSLEFTVNGEDISAQGGVKIETIANYNYTVSYTVM